MTRSLGLMQDWLVESGVTVAAIESTSRYWEPPFYCLEEVNFSCCFFRSDRRAFGNLAAPLKQSHSGACLDAATPIESLALTRRITRRLARNNIALVSDLLGYGTEDLLDLS